MRWLFIAASLLFFIHDGYSLEIVTSPDTIVNKNGFIRFSWRKPNDIQMSTISIPQKNIQAITESNNVIVIICGNIYIQDGENQKADTISVVMKRGSATLDQIENLINGNTQITSNVVVQNPDEKTLSSSVNPVMSFNDARAVEDYIKNKTNTSGKKD